MRFPKRTCRFKAGDIQKHTRILDPPTRDTQLSYLGEKRWTGSAPERAVIHVQVGAYGWLAPYRGDLPDRWPLSHGFMNARPVVVDPKPKVGLSVQILHAR